DACRRGEPLRVDDLGTCASDPGHALELPRRGTHAHDGAEAVAERAWVDVRAIARDAALVLHALEALGDRRRGQPHAPAELCQAEPGIVLQLGKDLAVRGVEQGAIGGLPHFPLIRSHVGESTAESRWTAGCKPYNTEGVASPRWPPHVYFVVSAVFHYLGPSFAVLLFARVEVLGVAWLRIVSAALVCALLLP